jgi:outer membrane receptor protein involved in Fe transport
MNNRNTLKYSRVAVRRQTLLVAISAVFCGAPALAQTVEPASDTEGVSLEEVTVTATRHAESLSKVPISVSAFTQDQPLMAIRSTSHLRRPFLKTPTGKAQKHFGSP